MFDIFISQIYNPCVKFQKIVPLNRTFFATFRGTIFFHWFFISDYLHIKINTKSHFGAITPLNRTFLPRFRGLIVSFAAFFGAFCRCKYAQLGLVLSPNDKSDTSESYDWSYSKPMPLIIAKYPTFSIATTVARGCTLAGKILIIYKFLKYSFAFFVIR